jgi:hypothetical protein
MCDFSAFQKNELLLTVKLWYHSQFQVRKAFAEGLKASVVGHTPFAAFSLLPLPPTFSGLSCGKKKGSPKRLWTRPSLRL